MGVFDQGSSSVTNMPDEIDGDDRLGVSRRTGIMFNSKLTVSTSATMGNYSLDESMYLDAATSYDELLNLQAVQDATEAKKKKKQEVGDGTCRHRRYSIIGNDPSFKQYTKNHDYDAIKYSEQRKEK